VHDALDLTQRKERRMPQSTTPSLAVGAVMHRGVINVPPQTPLIEAAAEMARSRVHCVVVEGLARGPQQQEELVWGIVSDLDLMRALAAGRLDASAGEMAATEIVTVEESESVEQASRLMAEHECTHLIVVAPGSPEPEPVGVISSLDVAAALAAPLRPRSAS
jgi:CBS domain-containing protein